jgi:hypothetical protein
LLFIKALQTPHQMNTNPEIVAEIEISRQQQSTENQFRDRDRELHSENFVGRRQR